MDWPTASDMGAFIRARRHHALLTQEELADRAGVDARTIRDIENGRTTKPRASTVRMLLAALEVPDSDPTPGPVPPRPRELPPDVMGFTGRAEQLAELDRLLDTARLHPTGVVIAAVTGTAGVGKTALAVHWAHRMAERFPDGQLYANLRGYDHRQPVQPGDVLAGFLDSLGVSAADLPHGQAERASRFRTLLAARQVLVVLDNAFDSEQIRDLLPGSPGSMVVVTSRDSLAGLVVHRGAHRVDLDLLPAGDAKLLLRMAIGSRVDTEPVAAAALAIQCAQLPLALRIAAQLAAARPAVPLAELVSELADEHRRLELLDAGDPHSSTSTVFSWSYRHLPDQAARLFRLIGLLPCQEVDLPAAAALAGTDLQRARQQADILARANLLRQIGRNRFGMHDLLHTYAAAQALDQDPPQTRHAAHLRLLDHCARTREPALSTADSG